MPLSDTYIALGDAIRRQYGTADKYSLVNMPKMIDGLHIVNQLDDGQFLDTTKGDKISWKSLSGLTIEKVNSFAGKSITLSCDVSYSGFVNNSNMGNRIGIEYGWLAEDGTSLWPNVWLFPDKAEGQTHISQTFLVPDKKYTGMQEGALYNQINSDAVVKITNVKLVVNPLGGVVPANLLVNGHGPFLPQADYGANPYDNYAVYPDTKINMVYGKKYKLVAHTNGEFSNDHQPTVESNRCVLWLTNNKLSQIISDSNTSTGTIFTWWRGTDTYWLRVNAYHHGTANHIQAWDVSIIEV